MNEDKIKIYEIWNGYNRKTLRNILTFVQENVALVSLLFTAVIAVGNAMIRIVYYLIDYGYLLYFKIPASSIDILGDNLFYRFVIDGIIVLSIVLLNLLPYYVWTRKVKCGAKILLSFLIVNIPNVFLLAGFLLTKILGSTLSYKYLFVYLIIGFILGILFFSVGFDFGIRKHLATKPENKKKCKKQKKQKQKKKKTTISLLARTIIAIAILFVLESCVFIWFGFSRAAAKNEFMIITDNDNNANYAVLYEKTDSFIIARCNIEEGKILFDDKALKKEINKKDIEYTIMNLIQE